MSSGHLFCADRNGVKKLSVLAQDYPSAPANPSSLAKRDARGLRVVRVFYIVYPKTDICQRLLYFSFCPALQCKERSF